MHSGAVSSIVYAKVSENETVVGAKWMLNVQRVRLSRCYPSVLLAAVYTDDVASQQVFTITPRE